MVAWDGNVYLYCNVYFGRQCRIRVQRSTALFNYGQESFRGQFSGIFACAYCPVFCIHSQVHFLCGPIQNVLTSHMKFIHFSMNIYTYLSVSFFSQTKITCLSFHDHFLLHRLYTLFFLKLYFKNIISGHMTICIQ